MLDIRAFNQIANAEDACSSGSTLSRWNDGAAAAISRGRPSKTHSTETVQNSAAAEGQFCTAPSTRVPPSPQIQHAPSLTPLPSDPSGGRPRTVQISRCASSRLHGGVVSFGGLADRVRSGERGQGCSNIRMIGDDLVEPDYLEDLLYLEYPDRTTSAGFVILWEYVQSAGWERFNAQQKGLPQDTPDIFGDTSELSSDLR